MSKKMYEESYINESALVIQKKLGKRDKFRVENFPELIDKIGEPPMKDVNFYDYDGTRLFSYTLQEVQQLTALPDMPDHSEEGLTSQEWNWSLEELKAIKSPVEVGILLKTTDNKFHAYLDIQRAPITQYVKFRSGYVGGILVDWGDGSPTETNESTGLTTFTHEYTTVGKYVIKISSTTDEEIHPHSNCFNTSSSMTEAGSNVYKVELPDNVMLHSEGSFSNTNIETISFPKNIQLEGDVRHLDDMPKLKCIILPNSFFRKTLYYTNDDTPSLKILSIPSQTTYRWHWSAEGYNVRRLLLPTWSTTGDTLAGIEILTFSGDISALSSGITFSGDFVFLKKLYMMAQTQVPTWHSNIATFFTKGGLLYIPPALHDAWVAAENWSTYASQIIANDI